MFGNGDTHHCYFCFGYDAHTVLRELAQSCGMNIVGNPDIVERTYDVFGIDDARTLIHDVYLKPFGSHKIMMLVPQRVTTEAQHALLKVLEEPPAGVRIAFVLPASTTLLDTILSRGVVVKNTDASHVIPDVIVQTYAKRLAFVEKLVKSDDAVVVEKFLNDMEQYVHERLPAQAKLAHIIRDVRLALVMRGTSKKQLLERIMLAIPQS